MAGRLIACGLWLLLGIALQARAASLELGTDISVGLYADADGNLTVDEVAALPDSAFRMFSRSEPVRVISRR